jgi:glycosyltransferase involved in cell wall biosynthesis
VARFAAIAAARSLLIVADTGIGGLGAVATQHATWFAQRAWRVVLASPDPPATAIDGCQWEEVPVPDASRDARGMLRAARRVRDVARRSGHGSVVHCHGARSFLITRAARVRRPFVTLHGHGSSPDDPWLNARARDAGLRLLPRFAAGAFTASPIGVRGWQLAVHASPRLAALAPVAFPGAATTPCVLWVGRIDAVKRCDQFVQAIAAAAREMPIRGVIAGDGPGTAAVDALIASTGAPVVRHGWVDDIAPYLAEAWAVALLSTKEAVTFSVQEAMWTGRPVIASRLPGLEWLLGEGEGGVLVDDVAGAAAAMRSLADHSRAAALGARAAARIRERIHPEDPWPRILSAYDRLRR